MRHNLGTRKPLYLRRLVRLPAGVGRKGRLVTAPDSFSTLDYRADMLTDPAFTRHAAYTLWRLDLHPVTGKSVKVPVHYDGRTRHSLGRKATRTHPAVPPNPAPPLTIDQAQQWLAHNRATGVGHDRPGEIGYLGIGFRPAGTGLACLDIDDCITADGQWSPAALDAIGRFPGAMLELSTSGRGLHIWFTTTAPLGRHGKDRSGLLELYDQGQFIAAGRQVLQGSPTVDGTAAAQALLAQFWPPARTGPRDITAPEWDELSPEKQAEVLADLRHALAFISADDRDVWIGVGQALVSLGDVGFDLWDEWSATSDAYQGREDLERTRVTGDRTGFQAVFARAAQHPEYLNPRSTEARVQHMARAFDVGVVGFPSPALTQPAPTATETIADSASSAESVAPWDATHTPATPAPAATETVALSFAAAAEGAIAATLPNVVNMLRTQEMTVRVGYDEFLARPMLGDGKTWRPMRDSDAAALRYEMEQRGFKSIGPEIMKSALTLLAEQNRFDSAIQWANGLQWDGVPRVTGALTRYFGVAPGPYAQACSEYLFTALAGRCLDPGCQADMALILVGLQGARKTSAIMALAPQPDMFVKVNLAKRDEDLSRRLRGKLVAELPELRGLTGRDIQGIRDWITNRNESWVEKYQAYETTFKRRFIGIGSANEDEVLDDPEGERRWLPMQTGVIDQQALQQDCAQLWAEGVAMWRAGGIRWQEAERLARDEHGKFKVVDEWSEAIWKWLSEHPRGGVYGEVETGRPRGEDPFKLVDAITGALGFIIKEIREEHKKRVYKILKNYGYVSKVIWEGDRSVRRWMKASKA